MFSFSCLLCPFVFSLFSFSSNFRDVMDTSSRVLVQFVISGAPPIRNTGTVEIRGNCQELGDWDRDERSLRNVAMRCGDTGNWTLLVGLRANSKIEWKVTLCDSTANTVQWVRMWTLLGVVARGITKLYRVSQESLPTGKNVCITFICKKRTSKIGIQKVLRHCLSEPGFC